MSPLMPLTDLPLMATIMSPSRIPAQNVQSTIIGERKDSVPWAAAGDKGVTRVIRRGLSDV